MGSELELRLSQSLTNLANGYDRSRQNKSVRDEELRKVERLSTTNDLTTADHAN